MSGSSMARQAARLRAKGPEAPVVLDPRAGKPRTFSVAPAAVGEIRIRRDGGGSGRSAARFIKVAGDGPKCSRWRPYARWWWEQNRGPIPAGKVVVHLDGNRLNDDPSNLALGTTDDALFIAHSLRPGINDSPLRRERVREFNSARSRLRRLAGPLADRWYLVDVERQRIWNTADRSRGEAIARVGVVVESGAAVNGRGWIGAVLGWPGAAPGEAALLAALADADRPLALPELRSRAAAVLARFGGTPPVTATWSSWLTHLRARGWVMREGRGPMLIAFAAVTERKRTTRLLPVQTNDLGRFDGFKWVSERGQDYQRVAGSALDQLLQEATS